MSSDAGEREPASSLELLYSPAQLAPYFAHGNVAQQLARFQRSLAAARSFLADHPAATLASSSATPAGLAASLQYSKDETFLTLYAFVSLDLTGSEDLHAERERLFTALPATALPERPLTISAPKVELEGQLPAPKLYLDSRAVRFADGQQDCAGTTYAPAATNSPASSTPASPCSASAGDLRPHGRYAREPS